MKIGVFDSGLGGLVIACAVRKKLSDYDYIYLGDTKNLPYGDKSQKQIYQNTIKAIDYLFKKNCALIIIACNTVSSQALRKIQQEWLPKSKYKDRRVLGVIRPTVEMVGQLSRIGLIGTIRTIDSTAYLQELQKINPEIQLVAKATPKLVPMIESGNLDRSVLKNYLSIFKQIDALILGCTHYGLLEKDIRKIIGQHVKIIAQEKIIPGKLKDYLKRHKEITKKLSHNSNFEIKVTKLNNRYAELAQKWFGKNIKPELAKI